MAAIIGMSFKEIYKKKAFVLGAVLSLAYLFLYGTGLHLLFKDMTGSDLLSNAMMQSQLISVGLYFASFIVALLVILTSSGSISSEVDNGIMYSVASKPVSRTEIVMGKFIGIGCIMVLYASCMFLAVIGINAVMGSNLLRGIGITKILKGLALFDLIPVILLSFTILGSTALNTIGAGVVSIILYGLASVGGMMEQIGASVGNASLVNIGIISGLIMPTDTIYRKMFSSMLEIESGLSLDILDISPFGGSVLEPSVWMVLYAALYAAAMLWCAIRVFNRKDI